FLPGLACTGHVQLSDRSLIETTILIGRNGIPADVAQQQILARVSNHAQKGVVGVYDGAIQGCDDHSDEVGFDEPSKASVAHLACFFGLDSLADIPEHALHADDVA